MASKLRPHLTYANVVSSICLFVVLGGTSYAVARGSVGTRELKDNSVRSRDVRNNDLRSKDVKDASLFAKDFKPGQLPRGEPGRDGALTADTPLASGQTERGVYAADAPPDQGGCCNWYYTAVNFRIPLDDVDGLPGQQVHFVPSGQTRPAECSGAQPQPGHLCVYETEGLNTDVVGIRNPEIYPLMRSITFGASRFGFMLEQSKSTSASGFSYGRWAVTAP